MSSRDFMTRNMGDSDLDYHPVTKHLEPRLRIGSQGKTLAIIAMIIAVAALLALIAFFLIWLFTRNGDTKNPGWQRQTTSNSASTYRFEAGGQDLLKIGVTNGNCVVTIAQPTSSLTPLDNRMFIIDNTGNSSAIDIKADNGLTLNDSIEHPEGNGSKVIGPHMSAMFIWGEKVGKNKPTTITRLY